MTGPIILLTAGRSDRQVPHLADTGSRRTFEIAYSEAHLVEPRTATSAYATPGLGGSDDLNR